MLVWIGLILFIAVWMFVLGILVGRGSAPVNLEAGRLEQELAALKAKMLRQERSRVEARAAGQKDAKSQLDFYEALKDPDAEKRLKTMPVPRQESVPPRTAKPAVTPKPEPRPVAPKPKPTAKPAPAPAAATGKFTVQVASLKDVRSAERLVAELKKKGYRAAYRIRSDVPGKGIWHRVRVGAYADRASAGKMAGKLKAAKFGAMVVSMQ
jgi:cell division septation protein DedD